MGYIWVAIFVTEVTKGHMKSITKKSQQGRGREDDMRALDLLNMLLLCQCFLLPQAAGEAGRRGHVQPEPLQPRLRGTACWVFLADVRCCKGHYSDKSQSLKSKKERISLRNTVLKTQSGMSATGNTRKNLTTARF